MAPRRHVKPTDLGSLWRQWYTSSQQNCEKIMTGLRIRQSEERRRAKVILQIAKFMSDKAERLKKREDSFSYRVAKARFSLRRWKKFST